MCTDPAEIRVFLAYDTYLATGCLSAAEVIGGDGHLPMQDEPQATGVRERLEGNEAVRRLRLSGVSGACEAP
jgi:hypothetical protein